MYVSRGSIIYVMTALTFVAYIQVNSCCSYVFQCEQINLYVAFSENQQAHDFVQVGRGMLATRDTQHINLSCGGDRISGLLH